MGNEKVEEKQWNYFTQMPAPILSECREMVLVPGGISEKIRNLQETLPEYCWQYPCSSVLINYYLNTARDAPHSNPRFRIPAKHKALVDPFYAFVNYKISPWEFYVQPKPMDKAWNKLNDELQRVYASQNIEMPQEHIFSGVPCCAFDMSVEEWRRAEVDQLPAGYLTPITTVPLKFIDWGNHAFVPTTHVRPLHARFGKLPPLALPCRVFGVTINDLEMDKVEEFIELLDELDNIVRIEIVSTSVPYMVNLLHPTLAYNNLAAPFFSRPIYEERKRNQVKSLSSDSDRESDDDSVPKPHVLRYPRLLKPPCRVPIEASVSHIENARFIYVHCDRHNRRIRDIEGRLQEMNVGQNPPLPRRALMMDTACALLHRDRWIRGVIRGINRERVRVQAVDYGWCCSIGTDEVDTRLRPLPAATAEEPQVYLTRVPIESEPFPHHSVTGILQSILADCDGRIVFCVDKRNHGPPFKANFNLMPEASDHPLHKVDLNAELQRRFKQRGFIRCTDLCVYEPGRFITKLYESPIDFEYEVFCPQFLMRGKLSLADLTG